MDLTHNLRWRLDQNDVIIALMPLVYVVVLLEQATLLTEELSWLNTIKVSAVEHVLLPARMMPGILILQVMLINAHSVFIGLKAD